MMVSRTGEITMLGPVQLLPYDKHQHDPRISFRKTGSTQWDLVMRSDGLCLPKRPFSVTSALSQKMEIKQNTSKHNHTHSE